MARILSPLLLIGIIALSRSSAQDWVLPLLSPDTFTKADRSDNLELVEDEAGRPHLRFADPVYPEANIQIDLSGNNLSQYDALHFELWMEHEPIDITATLRGYPDDQSGRRWYASKRFQPLGEWTEIRLDFDLDDDLSPASFDESERSLRLQIKRQDAATDPLAVAEIRNLRLVRKPIRVSIDYRQASFRDTNGDLTFTYPVTVENRTDAPIEARLEVITEAGAHFAAKPAQTTLRLGPGSAETVDITLSLDTPDHKLPTGYAEMARMQVSSPDVPDYTALPVRGYRPVYLFAVVPPAGTAHDNLLQQLRERTPKESASLRAVSGRMSSVEELLKWPLEAPPAEAPCIARVDGLRCPECKSQMDVRDLHTYYCYSRDIDGECPLHLQEFTVEPDHRFFPNMLAAYHKKTAGIAKASALVYLLTEDERYAAKALDILETYQSFYGDLPLVSAHSTGFHSRLKPVVLFERHLLDDFVDAFLILREKGYGDPESLDAITNGFLLETLFNVNQHYYGTSASQIDMVTQALKAAVILEKWAFFADALVGDGGVRRILDRNFNEDGVGVDGGDYARQAARQVLSLGNFLEGLGIDVDHERLEMIERNSVLMGYLPRPPDFQWETQVLENSGFTFLVHGEGPERRRATINWGSSRERSANDILTTVFHDAADEKLIHRTLRIAWGRPESFYSYQSVSQNIPVVDEGNIAILRMEQVYLGETEDFTGVLVTDQPGRRAYPGTQLARAVILFDGMMLVADRLRSECEDGRHQFDFPILGLDRLSSVSIPMENFDGELGQSRAYRLPSNLQRGSSSGELTLEWTQKDRGLRTHYVGGGFTAFRGRAPSGWRGELRDIFLIRTSGHGATASVLYEPMESGDAESGIVSFETALAEAADGTTASNDQALAYRIQLADGRTARVLISLDGGTYRSGAAQVKREQRIAVAHE